MEPREQPGEVSPGHQTEELIPATMERPFLRVVGSSPGKPELVLVVLLGSEEACFGSFPTDAVEGPPATVRALGWYLVE